MRLGNIPGQTGSECQRFAVRKMVDDFKGDAMEQDAVDALLPLGFDEYAVESREIIAMGC